MPPQQRTVAERRGGGGINGGPGSKQASAKGPPHQQRGGAGGRVRAAQQQQQLRQEEAEVRDMLDMVLEFLVHAGFEETVATLKKQLRDLDEGQLDKLKDEQSRAIALLQSQQQALKAHEEATAQEIAKVSLVA